MSAKDESCTGELWGAFRGLSTTPRILCLPEELLEAILRIIRDAGTPPEFWNCLKTCQKWHRIGLGLHGHLDHSVSAIIESRSRRYDSKIDQIGTGISLATDFCMGRPSQLYLSELRSLTVHVLHSRIASPFNAIPGRDVFESMGAILKVTRKLSTFSLKFADNGWDFPYSDVPAVPEGQIARLIASIPETVINLEIDTAGVDVPSCPKWVGVVKACHLCHQIGEIMGRLQHLRLRVAHICEDILAHGPLLRPCPCEPGCECCVGVGKDLCESVRSWNLRSFTVWLPPELEQTDALVRALKALCMFSTAHGPVTIIISQMDWPSDRQWFVGSFRPSFMWRAESNLWTTMEERPYAQGHTLHNYRSALGPISKVGFCAEHALLTTSPRRLFQIGADAYPKSPYPYIAEWLLEGSNRWAQDGHGGCRYPAPESEDEQKPFWKQSHTVQLSGLETMHESGGGLFACLFPDCRMRCQSLHHLRGHQLYAHPTQPHLGTYQGVRPCPSVGCDRVGLKGFSRDSDLETHLLTHHLHPCTSLAGMKQERAQTSAVEHDTTPS